jgi:2-polyprenyl-3-methyl-5-hydroxy-6-metoxy-1,4-benzoquinol methylase
MDMRKNNNSGNGIQERWVSEKKEWKSLSEFILFLKQKKAYQYAGQYCNDKVVLDYGCGSGYGTALLSQHASHVIGVDTEEDVIDFCNRTIKSSKLAFSKVDSDSSIPFNDKAFDVIVSFQVIEHVNDVRRYLLELKRVLKDNGVLFITTPNRKYRLLPFQKPWNKQHLREYSSRSIRKTLTPIFNKIELKGIYGVEEINKIEINRVKQSPFKVYIYHPVLKILNIVLPDSFYSFLRSYKHEVFSGKTLKDEHHKDLTTDRNLPTKYSLDDFTVGGKAGESLDLLAICYKK